jgi:hypothetical protein
MRSTIPRRRVEIGQVVAQLVELVVDVILMKASVSMFTVHDNTLDIKIQRV